MTSMAFIPHLHATMPHVEKLADFLVLAGTRTTIARVTVRPLLDRESIFPMRDSTWRYNTNNRFQFNNTTTSVHVENTNGEKE